MKRIRDGSRSECADALDSKKTKSKLQSSEETKFLEGNYFLRTEDHNKTCGTSADICDIENVSRLVGGAEQSRVKLEYQFYDVRCEELAKSLLGKLLVRTLENGTVLKGRIVETECYLGGEDRASHSYNGRITPRNKPMYEKPGTIYVYFTYGMYFCFNISSRGDGAVVLVRAVDPLEGQEFMLSQRIYKRMNSKKNKNSDNSTASFSVPALKISELCNGPGKLCISFGIDDKSCNMQDLCTWDRLWVEADSESEKIRDTDIITSTRIGIDSAGPEWAQKPLRFYVFGNRSISKRDKTKERERMSKNI